MKKKLLLIVLFICTLTLVSGCTDNTKKDDRNTLSLNDEKYGYLTTFKYDKNDDFKITNTETSGKFAEIEFESEKNNLEFQIYYFQEIEASWNISIKTRREQEGFKEYTWNKKDGYIYSVNGTSFNFNIKLDTINNDGKQQLNETIGLFGAVSKKDLTKEGTAVELFEDENVQKFMNSLEFTRKENK